MSQSNAKVQKPHLLPSPTLNLIDSSHFLDLTFLIDKTVKRNNSFVLEATTSKSIMPSPK